MRKFLQEFQAFISRGNVLDLAVAVIIGAAFSAIVNSLVKDLINPLLGFLVGKPDFTGLFIVLSEPAGYTGPRTYEALTAAGATVFGYGAFLTAVVHFLLLAFVIFWLIKVVTGLRGRLEALAKEKGRGGSGGQASSDARRHRAAARNSRSIERGLCQEVLTEAQRGCLRVDQTGLSMSMNVTSMSVSVAIRSPRARTPKRSVAWCPQAK